MEKWIKLEIEDETGRHVATFIMPDDWVPDGNGGELPTELDEIVYITPQFALGASTEQPSLGTGSAKAWYTKDVFENGTRISLGIFIKSIGGASGVGTGSYELYLPEEIEPAQDYYSGHANLWISGGGISEFDGSVKWTMRNEEKGPKLIFTLDGKEWTPFWPKLYADFKLRASIEYYL